MVCFKPVKKFESADLPLPVRKTKDSAGYDFVVAEKTVVPSILDHWEKMCHAKSNDEIEPSLTFDLDGIKALTKETGCKPTLVSTGMKAYLDEGTFLQLSVRSSCPLKNWLVLANGVGIIDADYVDNLNNEGEIFFQIINLSPYTIVLNKGDAIGQGIIMPYLKVDGDSSDQVRKGGHGSTDE